MRGKDFSERTYPHLSDTKFPDLPTVNVYKYQNEVPYENYSDTVKIKMMNVSWCGDYDNTVYFETKEERDAWFIAQDGLVQELPTMFRLYPSGTIKVPCTIDEAMNYNYVMIDYGKTIYQEGLSDNHIMFYFINGVEQKSPNATELTLIVDYWTTYINDMDIEYVSLQRGHAPMAATLADEYLSNPIDNCEFLLTPDVNYGEFQRVITTEPVIFNDDNVTVGFLTNASMQKSWFSDGNPKIPTAAFEYGQAFSAIDIFVIDDLSLWNTFRDNVTNQHPEFWETVKGMFIIPKKLITESNYLTGNYFMFCGVKCHHLETDSDKMQEIITFTKDKFKYPQEFADIAKLYTYPYAAIEVDDFKGHQMIIKIEDTSGQIELHTIMCDMYPFLNVEAYMTGIGSDKKISISFKNSYENTFRIGGRDYNFTTKWQIPTFAVQLEVEDNWELNGKITSDMFLSTNSRAALLMRNNSNRAALTVKTIINDTNTTNRSNLATSNAWGYDKVDEAVDLLTDTTAINITKLTSDLQRDIDYQAAITNIGINQLQSLTFNNNVAAFASTAFHVAGHSINSALSMGQSVASELGSKEGVSGNNAAIIGASAVVDGFTSYGVTAVGAIQASANAGVMIAADMSGWIANATYMGFKSANAKKQLEDMRDRQNDYTHDIGYGDISTNNTVMTASYNQSDANALNQYNTMVANNNDAYNTMITNYNERWDAEHRQKLLDNPPEFGQLTGTPDIISKPFGVRYNFITQSKNAIRQAGEQFLRYGYFLNMEWKIESFNLMSMFTYWKCDRVYCNDKGVYEGAQDMIKSILVAGTTVWRHPEDIGVKSIYQNKIPA